MIWVVWCALKSRVQTSQKAKGNIVVSKDHPHKERQLSDHSSARVRGRVAKFVSFTLM